MYDGPGTVAHTASQWRHTRRAGGFSRNDVMAAISTVWRHTRNQTLSVHAYSLEEQYSANFHPDRIWNDEVLGFSAQQEAQEQDH